jgi:hypothetical protein
MTREVLRYCRVTELLPSPTTPLLRVRGLPLTQCSEARRFAALSPPRRGQPLVPPRRAAAQNRTSSPRSHSDLEAIKAHFRYLPPHVAVTAEIHEAVVNGLTAAVSA